jgi:hypothetical protein
MMRKVIICLALGSGSLWIFAASAKGCGFGYAGFVPYSWGSCSPGFFRVGVPLGPGLGYPGILHPFSGFRYFGFYPGIYPSPPQTPPIAVYTITPGYRIRRGQPEAPSGPITRGRPDDQPGKAQAVAGRGFRQPAPAPVGEAQYGNYVPRLCYQGECRDIDPSVALSPDPPPGIIVWEPRD